MSATTNKLLKGSAIVTLGLIFAKIANFSLQLLLSHSLGAASYGLYVLGFSVITIISAFSLVGLEHGVVRFGAKYVAEEAVGKIKGMIFSALGVTVLLSLVASFSLWFFAELIAECVFGDPKLKWPLSVFAFSLPCLAVLSITSQVARGFQKLHFDAGLMNLAQPLLTLICIASLLAVSVTLEAAVVGYCIAAAMSAGLALFLLRRIAPQVLDQTPAEYELLKLLRFSMPMFGASLSVFFIVQTDKLMLGAMSSSTDVGIYNAAGLLAVQIAFALKIFNSSFSPVISELHTKGEHEQLGRLYRQTTLWILCVAIPIALVMLSFAPQLMSIFGAEFVAGELVLCVLAIAYLYESGAGCCGYMLVMSGKQDTELMNTLFTAGLNLILNYLFIPVYGILGAAMATGSSIFLVNILRTAQVWFYLRVFPYSASTLKLLGVAVMSYFLAHVLPGVELSDTTFVLSRAVYLALIYSGVFFLTFRSESQALFRKIAQILRR